MFTCASNTAVCSKFLFTEANMNNKPVNSMDCVIIFSFVLFLFVVKHNNAKAVYTFPLSRQFG